MQLPQALHMLESKTLNLGDTVYWKDKSEVAVFQRYVKARGVDRVLALCFTTTRETSHHWDCYASGTAGICIVFRKGKLLEAFKKHKGLKHGLVKYELIRNLPHKVKGKVHRWPFYKRSAFSDEKEYRIVYSDTGCKDPIGVKFTYDCIDAIYCSPWLSDDVLKSVKGILRKIVGQDHSFRINRTTVLENKEWIESFVP